MGARSLKAAPRRAAPLFFAAAFSLAVAMSAAARSPRVQPAVFVPRAEAACAVPPLQPFVFGDVQYRVAGNRPQTVRTGAEIGAIRELRTPCVDTVSCDGGGRCEPYPPPQPPYSVKLPIRRLVGIRPEVAVAVRRKWRAEDPPYLLAVALDVCTGTRSNAALVRCLRQASHSL